MNRSIIFVLVTALGLVPAALGAPKRDVDSQRKEFEVLKQYLQEARDSLQTEITERWRYKQRYVEQREIDKEQSSRLRELQERAFNDLSRIKEECFSKERRLEDERKEVEKKKDEWLYVTATFDGVLDKESQYLADINPLHMEDRRRDLEDVRRVFRQDQNPGRVLPSALAYHKKYLNTGGKALFIRQTVMPNEGDPSEMNVVSFGNVFAYAVDDAGTPFVIRQTGKLGSDRYTIEEVGSDDFKTTLQQKVPQWVKEKAITGPAPVDVMQNDNTGILISGKKVKASARMVSWLKAGGPVMFPLLGLLVWGLVLVVVKLFQYNRKDKSNKDLYETVVKMLAKKENDKAFEFARRKKGVVARVVTTCLEHSKWNRASAEKAVRELLIDEVPQLDKHLATLAVISAAAPLCGLLGTVTGMISLFQVITHYGTSDPKILAGGISEALITTQTGLSVAIPILLIHNALRNKSLHIQSEMQKHAMKILNRIWPEI